MYCEGRLERLENGNGSGFLDDAVAQLLRRLLRHVVPRELTQGL